MSNHRVAKSLFSALLLAWGMVWHSAALAVTDCANTAVTGIPQIECEALVTLYTSTNGPGWTNSSNWDTDTAVAGWYGVTVSGGQVTQLALDNNNLLGPLPDLNLPALQSLTLSYNQLSGPIPDFTYLSALQVLMLSYNQLSGLVPNFTNLPALLELYLHANQLTGTIPDFTSLPNLQYLYLYNNQLSGALPNFTNLPNLQWLSLYTNQLSGTVPNFSLPALLGINLQYNQLNGAIPDFSNMPGLVNLYLSNNQLSGPIPTFSNLPVLTNFLVHVNYLSGDSPDAGMAGLLGGLSTLTVNNNCLAPTDPTVIGILNIKDPGWNTTQTRCNPPPIASNVAIGGILQTGQTLTGTYTYTDPPPNATVESGSAYEWHRADDGLGSNAVLISGATATDYVLTATDNGKWMQFCVTPNDGINPGTRACSAWTGPVTVGAANCANTAVTGVPQIECEALIALYNSTNGPGWTNSTNWNTDTAVSTWHGVTVSGSNVIWLNLSDNQLSGALPDLNLPALQGLGLSSNQLGGSVPDFSGLPALQYLSLHINQLSGSVPDFSGLPVLQILDLSSNQLSGSVPDFSGLPVLQGLGLSSNQLSGSVPDFSGLPALQYLTLHINQLSGSVPDFSGLPALQILGLYSNQLSGGIPDFSNLPALQTLYLYSNQLSGGIPNFSSLPALQYLSLSSNQLNGPIPPAWTSLALLTELQLAGNYLSGDSPDASMSTWLGGLTALTVNNNCLAPSDAGIQAILDAKDPGWDTTQINCNLPPIATNAAILQTGPTLTGTYTYTDPLPNPTLESGSIYQWNRADDGLGLNAALIPGATLISYLSTPADTGKYISFCVRPSDGTLFGTEICSAWTGPVVGCVSSVTVTANADAGPGSLRQAIVDACPYGVITFAPSLGDIYLAGSALLIDKPLVIDGGAATQLISAGLASRIFDISLSTGTLELRNLRLSDGYALTDGGAIYYSGYDTSLLKLSGLTLQYHLAENHGGAVYSAGPLEIENSGFFGNTANTGNGGAVKQVYSTLIIRNSSFAGNGAAQGGALFLESVVNAVVEQASFSGNSAVMDGADVYSNSSVATLSNSILANALGGFNCAYAGNPVAPGNSLIEDGSCAAVLSGDPLLGQPGNYGGPSDSLPLLPGSPALDAGSGCLTTDQRGVARPQGTACDLGAFESEGFILTISQGDGQATLVDTPFALPLGVGVAPKRSGDPVNGGLVTFSDSNGGSTSVAATLLSAPQEVVINAGLAIMSVAPTANSLAGAYTSVSAQTKGAAAPVLFSLANTINAPPTAYNLSIGGSLVVGQILTGGYLYGDFENDPEGSSILAWESADDSGCSVNTALLAEHTASYTLTAAETGKYICFRVLPVAQTGTLYGALATVASTGTVQAVPNTPPTASNLSIGGSLVVGQILTGGYLYSDSENDPEGTSILIWESADDSGCSVNTALLAEHIASYTLSAAEIGRYICFRVLPVAQTGTLYGALATVVSAATVQSAPVGPSPQTISFAPLADKTYGDPPFTVSATASSGLPVSFSASGDCSLSGNLLTLSGAGSCAITASQAGNLAYLPALNVTRSFNISKAQLIVTAEDKTRAYGEPNPPLTLRYNGFVGADNESLLDILPLAEIPAIADSPPGSYPITLGGGNDDNYVFNLVEGALLISQASTSTVINVHNPDPSAANQPVLVNFVVLPTSGSEPTGTVTISDGAGQSCVHTLSSADGGVGRCAWSATAPGVYSLSASYAGDSRFTPSVSDSVSHTVAEALVRVTESDGQTVIGEDGQTDSYTLSLSTLPSAPVTLLAGADAQSELSLNGQHYSRELNITLGDTAPLTVFIRAIDDSLVEGRHDSLITHLISAGQVAEYPAGLPVSGIVAEVLDNDPGVIIVPETLSLLEGGEPAGYTAQLSTIPRAAVILSIQPDDPRLAGSVPTLTFPPDASALHPQSVSVSALDNLEYEGLREATIHHAIQTGDDGHYPPELPVAPVRVEIHDNDVPLLSLTTSGTGSGAVAGEGRYPPGEIVNLSATPDAGSLFAGWQPPPCAESFPMPEQDLECIAEFQAARHTLLLQANGGGSVSGGGEYAAGETVNLSAIPDPGWWFVGWRPAPCAGIFAMPDGDLTCQADFERLPFIPEPVPGPEPIPEPEPVPMPALAVFDGAEQLGVGSLLDFGQTRQDQPVVRVLSVINQGQAELRLDAPEISTGFSLSGGFPWLLPPSGDAPLYLRLEAREPGDYAGTFSFTSNDPAHPSFNLSLSGTVLASEEQAETPPPLGLEFSLDLIPSLATPVGTVLGIFHAVTANADSHPRYALVAGEGDSHNRFFSIIDNRLVLTQPLSTQEDHTIRIEARDDQGQALIVIFHIPIAAPRPVLLSRNSLPENRPPGDWVGELSEDCALPPDLADNAWFSLNNRVLSSAGTFDYRARDFYQIRLVCPDGEITYPIYITPRTPYYHSLSSGWRHICGLDEHGALNCWGWNRFGQASPPPLTGLTGFSLASNHGCALDSQGALLCWGDNQSGQASPPAGSGYRQVSAGGNHTCALRGDYTAACWGYDFNRQASPPGGEFSQLSAGGFHTCGLRPDRQLICWGWNNYGQSDPPAGRFLQVSSGEYHTCAVEGNQRVWCWGRDYEGQASPPANLYAGQVSAGEKHSCALRADGGISCWGDNQYGQASPPGHHDFNLVSAGGAHTCALHQDGSVSCWGGNDSRQLQLPSR